MVLSHLKNNEIGVTMVENILKKDIIQNGLHTISDITVNKRNANITTYFNDEKHSTEGLNPYYLRYMTKYLLKNHPKILLKTENALFSLFNLHIMYSFTFSN
jgi:hypothetical protein